MTVAVSCALCGAPDLIGAGVCGSCADDGSGGTLLFVRRSRDLRQRTETAARVRDWAGATRNDEAMGEVLEGRQPMARLPHALALRATRVLAETGIDTRLLPAAEWYRALPPSFTAMLVAMIAMGSFAGWQGVPILAWSSPMAAVLMLLVAAGQMRRPIRLYENTSATLTAPARAALASALAQLPAGRTRNLVLEVARVGEATFASLPEAFRAAALGSAVTELVAETGALALETERLIDIAAEDGSSANMEELEKASAARMALLEQTVGLLGRIARQGAESGEAALSEAGALLDQVRSEAAHRVAAEAEVRQVLG